MKYVNLGYITRLSYAELLFPGIRVPLFQSRSLGVRTAFQLEGVFPPDHKLATQLGLLVIRKTSFKRKEIVKPRRINVIRVEPR